MASSWLYALDGSWEMLKAKIVDVGGRYRKMEKRRDTWGSAGGLWEMLSSWL